MDDNIHKDDNFEGGNIPENEQPQEPVIPDESFGPPKDIILPDEEPASSEEAPHQEEHHYEEPSYSQAKSASSGSNVLPERIEGNTSIICACCHLGVVLAPFTIISGFVPLVLYFINFEVDGHIIKFQAKQAFIYFLAWLAIGIITAIPLFVLMLTGCGACLAVPIGLVIGFAPAIYSLVITIFLFQGKNYRIPYICEWAEQFGK